MIAIDTNVLVRLVTNDDPDQARKAADLLAGERTVHIAHTVLLEMEWVLRAVYDLSPPVIVAAMHQVLGLPSIHVDQAALIAVALEHYESGFDFADALHLALCPRDAPLYTFDPSLARKAAEHALAVGLP